MLPYRDARLTRIALIIFFLVIIGYAYYEARGLLFGPKIVILSQSEDVSDSPYILIQGQADHITSLSADGQSIPVTETGEFSFPYVLAPGLNRIVFDATDTYGNTARQVVQVVYTARTTSTSTTTRTTEIGSYTSTTGTSSTTSSTSTVEVAPTY
ncbi:MAG TPA: hypothetical protein VMU13_00270 [Candidatus Paceibacterota bacterium]|nr:hypothetical protein [Candidatus Paceibacterota bacterium]